MPQELRYKPLLDHAFKVLESLNPNTPDFSLGVQLEPIRYHLQELYGISTDFPNKIIQTDFKIEDNQLDGVVTMIGYPIRCNACAYLDQILSIPGFGKYYIFLIDDDKMIDIYFLEKIYNSFRIILDYDMMAASYSHSTRLKNACGTPYYDIISADYIFAVFLFNLINRGMYTNIKEICRNILFTTNIRSILNWLPYNITDPNLLTYNKLVSFLDANNKHFVGI